MKKLTDDAPLDYSTWTCVRDGRPYAVVWSVSARHVVCWCVDHAEARVLADRLNARPSRDAGLPVTARRLVRTLRLAAGRVGRQSRRPDVRLASPPSAIAG